MERFYAVVHVLGALLMIFGGTYLLPLLAALIYRDGTLEDFALDLLLTEGVGLGLAWVTQDYRRELKPRDGVLLVVLYWTSTAALASLPLLRGIPGLTFTDGYFEAMSGLSTTGATVLVGLDQLPPTLNLWRHALQWFGGMGIIVLAVAILPMLGVGGMQLYKAEMPGPIKEDKLTPRIAETARTLWLVYVGITVLCMLALRLAGMNWFDAICHAFAALSLGGFSTHDQSVGYFDSPAIEAVLIVFMVLSAMNFATHFTAFHRISLRPYLENPEALALLGLVVGSSLLCATLLWSGGVYTSYGTALRHTSFNLVSIATDCGFASVDFGQWPVFVPMWMLFLSSVTANAGSTGGGIKMFRTLLLWQQAGREMLKLLHPNSVLPVRVGAAVVPNKIVFAVLAFIFVYFMTLVVLSFALMGSGLDFISSFTAIVACINNAGPGLAEVGPASNYQGLSDFQTWVCTLAMLLGRLEIFTVLVIFTPAFWRK